MFDFLRWERDFPNDNAKELDVLMQYRSSIRQQPQVVPGFCSTNDVVLHELGTQWIRQVLRATMVSGDSGLSYSRTKEVVMFLFCDHMVAVTLLNCACLLQLISDWSRRMIETFFMIMTTATIFEVIIFSTASRSSMTAYRRRHRRSLRTSALVR